MTNRQPKTKKSLGQHWLDDQDALESIVRASEINKADLVLEVGPGPGGLTRLLVKSARRVIAIELDDNLSKSLKENLISSNLEIFNEDILHFNLNKLPKDYKLVANIPYYLTSNLIRKISEADNPPSLAVILIQKEVAERVAAKPGDISLLSITAQYYWEVTLGPIVEAYLFTPPPKVDSRVLILKRRTAPLFEDIDVNDFFDLVRAGFSQRRKTLLNALSAGLKTKPEVVTKACQTIGLDPKRRAQTLSLEEWHDLYLALLDLLSNGGIN